MDTYVLLVYHWRYKVNIFYFEYQVAGDYVGIRDCNIYVGLIIEYGDSR